MNKPRFDKVAAIASRFIIEHNIQSLPINPFDIIATHSNWRAITYDNFAQRHNIDIEDVIEWAESVDGCVHYYAYSGKEKYLIFYNDNPLFVDNFCRIRWTVMHEIGHIYLGHLKEIQEAKITRNTLTKEKYEQLEIEAHYFAACVLAPIIVLFKLSIRNSQDIMNICQISKEASDKRFEAYQKWCKKKIITEYDYRIFKQFKNFILTKHCFVCGGVCNNKALYCPICGSDQLKWGDGNMIYNDGYEVDERGRASVCPRCANEEIDDDANYCKICGLLIINRCTWEECYAPAEGNARYCIHCGSPTTFNQQELFKNWADIKTCSEAAMSTDDDDDDLPF